jgi:type I restriction enzyme S subunit
MPVISYGQIHSKSNTGTKVDKNLLRFVPISFTENNESSKVHKGDFIFADTSEDLDGCGNCVYIDTQSLLYAGYHSIIARSHHNDDNNKYLAYLFKTPCWRSQIRSSVNGVKVFSITQNTLAESKVILPSSEEQQIIASYLDYKVEQIDRVIAEKEQMLEDLKAYRSSIISEAVTRGLDKNAKMKKSSIVGLDNIPEKWKVMKTLYCLSMPITDGPHTTPDLYDSGIPFISAEAVSCGNGKIDFSHKRGYISQEFYDECCKKYIPQRNDIYMIKSGATTGKVAIVDTDDIFTIWSPLAVFRCNEEVMLPSYMFFLLQSPLYQSQVEMGWSFGTQQNIGMRTLEKIMIPVPPIEEQKEIAHYVDTKISATESSFSAITAQIEDLNCYKSSVISEAVTGKIDLRVWNKKNIKA